MTVHELVSALEQTPRSSTVFVIGADGRRTPLNGVWRSLESNDDRIQVTIVGSPWLHGTTPRPAA